MARTTTRCCGPSTREYGLPGSSTHPSGSAESGVRKAPSLPHARPQLSGFIRIRMINSAVYSKLDGRDSCPRTQHNRHSRLSSRLSRESGNPQRQVLRTSNHTSSTRSRTSISVAFDAASKKGSLSERSIPSRARVARVRSPSLRSGPASVAPACRGFCRRGCPLCARRSRGGPRSGGW